MKREQRYTLLSSAKSVSRRLEPRSAGVEVYMDYRVLGRTGLQVSVMGFGGGGIGGVWGATTDRECVLAVQRALALGINFFDVAPSYGNGKAEENLGAGLKGQRGPSCAILVTSVGTAE